MQINHSLDLQCNVPLMHDLSLIAGSLVYRVATHLERSGSVRVVREKSGEKSKNLGKVDEKFVLGCDRIVLGTKYARKEFFTR